jgi:hypothetical protein
MQQSEHKQTEPHPFQRPFKDLLSGSLGRILFGICFDYMNLNRVS